MPPAKYLPGTKSAATPSEYTDAQYAALEKVKQKTPKLRFGAARKEFVNKVMLADGKISSDMAAVRKAAAKAEAADKAAVKAFVDAHEKEILADSLGEEDALSVEDRQQLVNLRSRAAHRLVDELEEHIAQKRFLFIVDADLVPRIYFQCAVKGNPDVELA